MEPTRRTNGDISQNGGSHGTAVQVINVKTLPGGGSHLVLEKSAFHEILNQVGDRHVYLLSIAGASRQGKSFLMNVIRHYLDELEKGEQTPFMNIAQKDSLEGFHIENRNERGTIGFFLWSKPFIFKQSSGKEIAVLLMDTQGVFDKFTTKKEWSMIVGLSLLTSSCMIYNLLNNLLEDNLGIFSNFVEFGMLSMREDKSATNAFHKLLFLIRDWQFPNDNSYGAVGGKQFIDKYLKITEDMPEELKIIRKSVLTVFAEKECFLMPHPGSPAKENDYNGSLRNLDPIFLQNLENFLDHLFKVDELRPLTIKGKTIRGKELPSYFSKYIEILNSQKLPTASSILNSTKEAELQAATQGYLVHVTDYMKKLMEQKEFLSESDLKQEFETECNLVLSHFLDSNKDEPPELISKLKVFLIRELKALYVNLIKTNSDAKDQFIRSLLEFTEAAYKTKVEESTKGIVHSVSDMKIILDNCKEDVLRNINIGSQDESFLTAVYPNLESVLASVRSTYMNENQIKLSKLEQSYQSCFKTLLKDYNNHLNLFCPEDELKKTRPEQLLTVHKRSEEDILNKLNTLVPFDNQKLKEKAIEELKSLTSQEFERRLEMIRLFQDSKNSEAMALVQKAINKYCMQMNAYLDENNLISEKEISDKHTSLKLEANTVLFQIYNIVSPTEVSEIQEKLDSKVAEAFENFKSELKARKEDYKTNWEKAIKDAELTQDKEAMECSHRLPHPSEEDFNRYLLAVQTELIAGPSKAKWLSREQQNQLCIEIQQQLLYKRESLLTSHRRVLQKSEEKSMQEVRNIAEEYSAKLKGEIENSPEIMTVEKLKNIHTNLSSEYVAAFNTKWSQVLPKSLVTKAGTALASKLKKIYCDWSRIVETNVLEITKEIEKIILDCRVTYMQEMEQDTDVYSDRTKLQLIHVVCQSKADKSFNKLTKRYSKFPQLDQMYARLSDEIDKAYKEKIQTLEINKKRLEGDLEKIRQESLGIYRMEFTRKRPAFRNERDLDDAHNELMNAANNSLEQRIVQFPSVSVQQLFQEKASLKSLMEKELVKQREDWNLYNNNIDAQTKSVIQGIMDNYQTKLNEITSPVCFLPTERFNRIHEELLKSGLQKLRNTKKPPGSDPKVYENQLKEELSNMFACFLSENRTKREKAEDKVKNNIQAIKTEYSNWLSAQLNPQGMIDSSRTKYLMQVKDMVNSQFTLDEQAKGELWKVCEQEIIQALDSAQQEWEQIEPLPSAVDLAVIKCRELYEKEMNTKITPDSPLLHTRELKQIHRNAVKNSMAEFEKQVKQTAATKERLKTSLETAFIRYQDENDLKAADAGNIAIGIDLGTTYSCVAVYRKGTVEIIPDTNNHKKTVPSYVLFENKDTYVVGETAKDQSIIYPHTTVFDSKRLIGRRFDDKEVQDDMKLWPFRVINENARPKIVVHGESFWPEEISGKILTQLKKNAEKHLGHEVKRAVITVPAYFTDAQKRATRAAADFAGLEVLELLAEPTAAAIAYNFHYNDDKGRNTFVYDLGGGTFDVSILVSKMGKMDGKGVDGDSHLGGQDFDNAMVKYCIDEFNKTHNIYLENEGEQRDKDARVRRIRNRCENAKINLSIAEKVKVIIDRLYQDKDMDVEINRDEFNKMIEPMLQKTINVAKAALASAQLTVEDISDVVLVGGSSRIPRAQELLKELFKREHLSMALNPDEVVARGAAYRAAMLSGAKDRKLANIEFNNVAPFALGIQLKGDKFSKIIPKNTPVPCKMKEEGYTTTRDNQDEVRIAIYEGDDPVASKNNLLAEFVLKDIPPAPAGKEPIDISMDLDDEGLLTVSAVVRSTGGSKDITIDTVGAGLTKEEIAQAKARH